MFHPVLSEVLDLLGGMRDADLFEIERVRSESIDLFL